MSINVGGPRSAAAARPVHTGATHRKEVGFVTARYLDVSPKLVEKGTTVDITMQKKAVVTGERGPFLALSLPANQGHPGDPKKPTNVMVGFRGDQTPLSQAKQLEAALKKAHPFGFGISRHGATVSVRMMLMA